MRWERWAEYRPVRFGLLLLRRWLRHGVAVQSAALAFYLLFTVFPLLIFVSALLGLLQPDPADLLGGLRGFLPREVTAVAEMYLNHVGARPSPRLLVFGMVFSVYFPMRATNALMRAVRTAYHLGPPRSARFHRLKTLVYTVLLIATLVVSSVVSLTGLISFVGLLAPHGARLLTKNNRISTMFLRTNLCFSDRRNRAKSIWIWSW